MQVYSEAVSKSVEHNKYYIVFEKSSDSITANRINNMNLLEIENVDSDLTRLKLVSNHPSLINTCFAKTYLNL